MSSASVVIGAIRVKNSFPFIPNSFLRETAQNCKKSILAKNIHRFYALKEINSQTEYYLVKLCSNTYVFVDKMTKY